MNSLGKIALIMPRILPSMDNELVNGVSDTIGRYGYDTVVITGIYNDKPGHFTDEYADGLDNIYTLLRYAHFDGIIFPAGRFNREDVRERIFSILRNLDTPCVVLEHQVDDFECFYPPQREYIKLITEHLIREHGCKKLYCITGKEGERSSLERLEGFKDAMDAAGLPYDDSCIFYGKFWYDIPQQIASDIAVGIIPRPDGVVCANDDMAISLTNTLIDMGIRVPEDIKVTGYDGNIMAFFQNPSITTVSGHEYQLASEASRRILEMIGHREIAEKKMVQRMRLGSSCGCGGSIPDTFDNRLLFQHIRKSLDMYNERLSRVFTAPAAKIASGHDEREVIERVAEHSYMLPNWKSLDICLCTDWCADTEHPERFRTGGFSDDMLHVLSTYKNKSSSPWSAFPAANFLPSITEEHKPMIFVVTSIHSEGQIFGYFCSSYDDSDDFQLDEYYVNFIDMIANGLAAVQQTVCGGRVEIAGLSDGRRRRLHSLRANMFEDPLMYTIVEAAQETGMTEDELRQVYEALFGISFEDDLTAARLERAKWLLSSTSMSAEDIAADCGYTDMDVFFSDFLKMTQTSPYGFRKERHQSANSDE